MGACVSVRGLGGASLLSRQGTANRQSGAARQGSTAGQHGRAQQGTARQGARQQRCLPPSAQVRRCLGVQPRTGALHTPLRLQHTGGASQHRVARQGQGRHRHLAGSTGAAGLWLAPPTPLPRTVGRQRAARQLVERAGGLGEELWGARPALALQQACHLVNIICRVCGVWGGGHGADVTPSWHLGGQRPVPQSSRDGRAGTLGDRVKGRWRGSPSQDYPSQPSRRPAAGLTEPVERHGSSIRQQRAEDGGLGAPAGSARRKQVVRGRTPAARSRRQGERVRRRRRAAFPLPHPAAAASSPLAPWLAVVILQTALDRRGERLAGARRSDDCAAKLPSHEQPIRSPVDAVAATAMKNA